MLQDSSSKPPDELGMIASSQMTDRRQKAVACLEEVLKCPRCDSMNTKFCYYNNYSLSQPRHFCKNCRRYWTKGGALRNVPVGGGCRKNKRVKHRSVDANYLVSLDETTSNMLASMSSTNCSSFLSNLSCSSSSSYGDLSNESPQFGLQFSRMQEALRSREQNSNVPSNSPSVYEIGAGGGQVTAELLKGSCSQPTLISSLPSFDTNMIPVSYPSCTIKPEPGVLYPGSDFSSLFLESSGQMTGAESTANFTCLDEQLSAYHMSVESFDGSRVEAQLKNPDQKLAMQLFSGVHNGEQGHMLPAFEAETEEGLRVVRAKSIQVHSADRRPISEWGAAPSESYLETTSDSHFWCNAIWSDFHALSSSVVGTTVL